MMEFDLKRPPRIATAIGGLACAAAAINALAFTASTANAFPVSDAWYFIESFVRPALEGRLQAADFFVQRAAGDHSQPLQKLVLLADLHWTDLDFRLEAVLGILFAVFACLWLSWCLAKGAETTRERGLALLGAGVVFAVGLSLNATNVYTWYLVSLAWISLLLAFVYWRTIGVPMPLWRLFLYAGVATFVLALVLDELAFPAFIAAILALLLRDGVRNPKPVLAALVSGAVGLSLARWLLQWMAPLTGASDATGGSLQALAGVLAQPDAWKLIVVPLTASLVHPLHLIGLFPGHALVVQVAISAILVVAHACFWWRALAGRTRPRPDVLVLAVATMLFFYASIAGIALSRIPQYGMDYINQWRYVVVYQLNIIALALMFLSPQRTRSGQVPVPAAVPWAVLTGAVAILALQLPLSLAAWKSAPYVRDSARNVALALDALGRNPRQTPKGGCPVMLPICRAPVGVREATMAMLQRHRLANFSPRIRARYGLDRPLAGAAGSAEVDDARPCVVQALEWDPRAVGKAPFNVQPDGRSAYWLKVAADAPHFAIEFAGRTVETMRKDEIVTFVHSDAMQAAVANGTTMRFDLVCRGRKTGSFEVLAKQQP